MIGTGETDRVHDVIVVGAGLAGLVAATEIADSGRRVLVLDQEPEQSLGGQAFWSFGGLFLVDTPEQRRLRVHDSLDLAWSDWLGSAGFDRPEDYWPRQWAEAYVNFAAGEKRAWLHGLGMRWFPVVQWAERGGLSGTGHGNSVPRFHVTWGTGPGIVAPFAAKAAVCPQLQFRFRHKVVELLTSDGVVTGVRAQQLEPTNAERGVATSRNVVGEVELSAQAVVVAAGGIGGNHRLVRAAWPPAWGQAPTDLLSGVPAHVDGSMLEVTARAGGRVINPDRMWHYPEGLINWSPIWPDHGIRVLAGPSSLWLDATGKRLPAPLFPGFDSLGALRHITAAGHTHSWFLLNQRTIEPEFALSGSEQNPDLTDKDIRQVLGRALPGPTGPVEDFLRRGADFVIRDRLADLVHGMNELVGSELVDYQTVHAEVVAHDRQVLSGYGKDAQTVAIHAARRYLGDRLTRVVKPHAFLDPAAGPLIAVRLHVLTRKTLGGLETDISGRVLDSAGAPIPGLFAAGEISGFGGGGMHGYRALEGTFLGGCLFSGRQVGRAAAAAVI